MQICIPARSRIGNTIAAKIPIRRLFPRLLETNPASVGPPEHPRSPASASSANIAVPPPRIDADAILNVPGHIIPTENPQFEEFWEAREKYDAVIGNRIERGDGKDRKFVENIVCLLLRMIFGVKIEDANAPFRLMKTSLVEKYIGKLPKNFNIPNIMFTTYFVYHHEKVIFIPITFKPRQGGVNSINIKKIVKIGWKAVGDFHKLRREINDV